MTELQNLKDRMHSARGAVSVVEMFVKNVDTALLDEEMQELHAATLRSLERLKKDFDVTHDTVCKLAAR